MVIIEASPGWPKDVRPPITSYKPSRWADTFTSFTLDQQVQQKYAEAIEALKEEARIMLLAANKGKTSDKLVLIDTLERLGLSYHFEQEIEKQLQEIFKSHLQDKDEEDYDLFTTSLYFRVLRQHRHHVSCSVFDKFKGEDNKLKVTLNCDAKGLLSLYEATHLRIHGEEILDEAVAFTTNHLNHMLQHLESPLKDQVQRALEQPLHRGIPRIETRYYISFYEKDNAKNDLLLKLAKLDFNYVQNMYKNDLCQLSRWWKELDLKPKLSYARNRVVETYLWGTSYHFEPQYSYVRRAVAKFIQMLTIVDDTYDNYATIEESDLFTQSLQRWNIDETNQLPDYLKTIYMFILRLYDEYEQGKSFAVPYAIETMKEICRAYNKGHKWCMGGLTPSFEDYIENTMITGCLYAICSGTIPGMISVSNETIDWLQSEPKIVTASVKVCRYLDDLGGHKRESSEGRLLTGVDFYMKQHGVSVQETADKFIELAEDAWKDMNTEWMAKTSVPKDMVEQVLGYARASEVFYRSGQDGYTQAEVVAPHIAAVFVDPIII